MIRVIAFLSILLSVHTVFAKNISDTQEYLEADMTVSAVDNMSVTSQKYAAIENTLADLDNRDFIVHKTYGIVKLSCPATAANITAGGTAEMTLEITYMVEENNAFVAHTQTSVLKIDMNQANLQPVAFVKLDRALKVSARITSVSIPSPGFDGIKLDFKIESEVFEKMLYTEGVSNLTRDEQYVPTEGSLLVSWDAFPKAESYELEWTYISNQDTSDVNLTLPLDKIDIRGTLFTNNSSRVEITGNSYKIPLMYEKGLIFYRVRPVGRNIANGTLVTVKGQWSLDENFTNLGGIADNNYYAFEGLEQAMNWQASLSFAEEGKNKAVLSYHDGTLRNRQTLTRINTDERSIVGETFYDYNGRPSIQVLPVPTPENNLYYYPQFNQVEGANGTPEPITKASYDAASQGAACTVNAPELDVHSGASGYYSSSNPFEPGGSNKGDSILNKDLLPDAQKYPYAQTKYTPDNTGRIAAQSGVGKAFQLNGHHETKYLYATPDQEEISRLFGSQVGFASYYKKNVVIDPNGQMSVSYLDLDGKVIATALAGGSPDSLMPLAGENGRTIEAHLLSEVNNKLSVDKLSKNYLKKFVVSENGTPYTFSYDFSADPYTINCKSKATQADIEVNLSPVLIADVELMSCGESLFKKELSGAAQFGTGAEQSGSFSLTKTLDQGEYTLTKSIRIDEAKLKDYLHKYLDNDAYTCVIPVGDYIHDSVDVVNLSGCGYSCETCNANVEVLIARLDSGKTGDALLSESEKEKMRSKCYDICRSNITCVSSLNGMLADMAINGQYGEIKDKAMHNPAVPTLDSDDFHNEDPMETDIDVPLNGDLDGNMMGNPNPDLNLKKFVLSIYNPDNILTVPPFISALGIDSADWHNPIQIVMSDYPNAPEDYNQCLFKDGLDFSQASYQVTDYYDTQGKMVYAKVAKVNSTTYEPAILETGVDAVVPVNEALGLYKVPIKYLKDFAVFRNYWHPNFPNYLVVYHPEYRYFVDCTTKQDINEYEYRIVTAHTLADDPDHKFVDANGNVTIMENDPLFAKYPDVKYRFWGLYNNYKVVDESAPTSTLNMAQVANLSSVCDGSLPSTQLDPGNTNAWTLFKVMYLAERNKILREKATEKAIANKYYNGCIGDADFRSADEASAFFISKAFSSYPTHVWQLHCLNHWNPEGCEWDWDAWHDYFSIPYYDSRQVCYSLRSRFLADKVRKFYPKVPSLGVELHEGRCTREVIVQKENGEDTTLFLTVTCKEDEMNFIKQGTDMVIRKRYEACGLCPLTSDIQDFLLVAQRKKLLDSISEMVYCPPGESPLSMGGTLTKEFQNAQTGVVSSVTWTGNYDATSRVLAGTLASLTKTIAITLNFAAGPSPMPAGMAVDFDKLKICCLTATGPSTFDLKVYYSGYYKVADNSLIASIDFVSPDLVSGYQKAEFVIEGTVSTNISLSECTIAPNCAATSAAKNIAGFLNTLNVKVVDDKDPQMVAPEEVPLYDTKLSKYYEFPLRKLLDINGVDADGALLTSMSDLVPKWSSSVAGSALSGTLKYLSDNVLSIEISPLDAGLTLDYTQVSYFTNIEPVSDLTNCSTNECKINSFMADAVVIDADNNKHYTKVEITVPNYTMTLCEKAIRGQN